MLQDLQFALRALRNSPGFALSAILALGLGIGSNSAIFSLIDGVLLRPLPFSQSDRLVNVWESNLKRNTPRMVAAPGNYYDWRAQNQVLQAIGAYQQSTFNLASTGNEPERFVGAVCDPGFFATLQATPALGRTFTADEDQPGRDVVVLGYSLWQQRFAGDPHVTGRTFDFDGRSRTVIGVMGPGFEYPAKATMWAPLALDSQSRARRDFHQLRVIARLKDGISMERARSDFETIGRRLAQQYPDLNKDESVALNSMLEDTVGQIRPALLVLSGAVAFVLLIACANVANLLLAKAASRQREIAIRASLGAGRARIVRQMLTESVVLASLGGLLGLLFAYGVFHALIALAPANVPRLEQAGLDWRVVIFTLGVAMFTGMVFGIAPAWQAAQVDFHSTLKEGSRGAGARGMLRSALVVAQVPRR